MILGFSTQINGKPTYFIEKIVCGLFDTLNITKADWLLYSKDFESRTIHKPKLHTIRDDKNDRWQVGTMIDFFINVRTKKMFRFAPKIPVVAIQKVEIMWFDLFGKKMVRVFIDNKGFACVKFDTSLVVTGKMMMLANNDGFDTIEDFFEYFNEDFKGKLIHWTDLKY